MSVQYRLLDTASRDATEIWDYVARAYGEREADRLVARFLDELEKIAGMPGMGHPDEDLFDERVRFWRVGSYQLVYLWRTRPIEVIAIVHTSRDLPSFFRDRTF